RTMGVAEEQEGPLPAQAVQIEGLAVMVDQFEGLQRTGITQAGRARAERRRWRRLPQLQRQPQACGQSGGTEKPDGQPLALLCVCGAWRGIIPQPAGPAYPAISRSVSRYLADTVRRGGGNPLWGCCDAGMMLGSMGCRPGAGAVSMENPDSVLQVLGTVRDFI